MGREAKGQKDPPEAVATLPPLIGAAHELTPGASWPGLQRGEEQTSDIAAVSVSPARWFDLLGAETAPPPEPRRGRLWALPLLLTAFALALAARGVLSLALLPVALATGALAVLARGLRQRQPALSPVQANRRGLHLDAGQLRLQIKGDGPSHPLLATNERFGVTLLSTPRRDRVLALLSSSAGVTCVGASFDVNARTTFVGLLDRASIVSADEAGLEAIGPDGEPISLAPSTLAALLDELSKRSPGCLDRFLLTDARGATLSLDGRELHAGGRVIDLTLPLEWRAFVFQEAIGQAIAVYQGTWVRQGASEIVLVCLLPAMASALDGAGVALSSLDRCALRDLRLMQGAPESPPPAEQRVAVDRLLMVPIRSALDRAPRTSAEVARARA